MEGLFDERIARERYDRLKTSSFYDKSRNVWADGLRSNQISIPTEYPQMDTQLLGVLAEGIFNTGKALETYEQLKQPPYYSHENMQWESFLHKTHAVAYPTREVTMQLVGVLIEGMFDRDKAFTQYKQLTSSSFFDPAYEQWKHAWYKSISVYQEDREPKDQLLGVLAEALFDKKSARRRYEKLKQTPLYDSATARWKGSIHADQTLTHWSHPPSSINQLLNVWIEKELEDEKPFAVSEEQVPVVRRF